MTGSQLSLEILGRLVYFGIGVLVGVLLITHGVI